MAQEPLPDYVRDYLDSLVPPRAPELAKMEAHAQDVRFPIIGPAAGYYCYQTARVTGARRIFEMGSGFGYSTAWFARAVQENGGGEVHHVVWDEELSQQASVHLEALGLSDVVRYQVAEAVQALAQAEGLFDIIFNDIDKHGYPASLPIIYEKLRPGGLLIIDNMLWHGWIFEEGDASKDTDGVREVTRLLTQSDQWIASLVPIRDGMIIAYKKP